MNDCPLVVSSYALGGPNVQQQCVSGASPPAVGPSSVSEAFSYFENLPYGGLLGPFPGPAEEILRFLGPALPYML